MASRCFLARREIGSFMNNGLVRTLCHQIPREEKKQLSSSQSQIPFPPKNMKNNWVGPPHPVSKLRLVEFYQPECESEAEKQFRLRRAAVQQWNQDFWEKHNARFYKMKEEYIREKQKELTNVISAAQDIKSTVVPPEEMSKFYKRFLDDNYSLHMNYNKEWYKKNIGLLLPAIYSFLVKLSRKLKLHKT